MFTSSEVQEDKVQGALENIVSLPDSEQIGSSLTTNLNDLILNPSTSLTINSRRQQHLKKHSLTIRYFEN